MTEREQSLIENIKKQTDAGFSKDEIQSNLLKEGYTANEFQAHLRNVSTLTSYQKSSIRYYLLTISIGSAIFAFKKYNAVLNFERLSPIVIFLSLVSLISFILFIYYVQKK